MIKKTLFVVMMCLLVSTMAVLGREHNDRDLPEQAADAAEEAVEKAEEVREKEQEITDESAEKKAEERVKSLRQSLEDRATKKKELLERAKKTREEAKESLKAAKDDLKVAREKFKESQKELMEVKRELAKCKGIDSAECKKSRKNAKTHAAKVVDSSIEKTFHVLQRARDAAERSTKLSEDERQAMVNQLNTKLEALNALRQKHSQIQTLGTAEEIKAAAKNMKEFWKEHQEKVKEHTSKVRTAKFGGVLEKMEHLQAKLDKELADFKKEGKDTAELEAKTSAFAEKLAMTKQLHAEVISLLNGVSSADDKSVVMKEVTEKMRQAHGQLKEAHVLLKEIQKIVRAQKALSAGITG